MKEGITPQPEDRSSDYTEQFKAGFRNLRFSPVVEGEFREYFLGAAVTRVRFCLPIATILTLVFIMTDHLRLPQDVVSST